MTAGTAALLCGLGSYLLGSVPFAFLIGLAKGIDIRTTGSKNIGATNLSRAVGRSWGLTAFSLDFLKGLLAVGAGRLVAAAFPSESDSRMALLPLAAGAAAILGHVFPIYLRFRGGKGVATTFGVMLGLSPIATVVAGAIWLGLYFATRTVSIASLGAAAALPILVALLDQGRPGNGDRWVLVVTIGLAALIFIRHRANIVRLLHGEELRFAAKKREEAP